MRTKQLQEAIDRMILLKLSTHAISAFKKGIIWESENIGALYECNEQEKEIIKKFETEHEGCMVYHMIHTYTTFGELYNILYVSPDTEEWEQDKEDIKDCTPFVYVVNKDIEEFSEFGCIGIKSNIGGVIRVS